MNIAVAADGESLESQVSGEFSQCLYLLIVNIGDDLSMTIVKLEEVLETTPEGYLAQKVLESNCEAVITGEIDQASYNILADAQVTRYLGAGYSVKDALELSEKRLLKLIRDECSNHHH